MPKMNVSRQFILVAACLASMVLSNCGRAVPEIPIEPEIQNDGLTVKTNACDLLTRRNEFDKQMVELTTFVRNGFEDFSLYDPTCPVEFQNIWIDYGGKRRTGTVYCCNVEPSKDREKPAEVDGMVLDLIENEKFAAFDQLVKGSRQTTIRATLVGRFFAGHPLKDSEKGLWGGFGHMGVYSLFVIREVKDLDPHDDRKDLDYSSEEPDFQRNDYRKIENISPDVSGLEVQKASEMGRNIWRFDDPARVALDALIRAARLGVANRKRLKQIDSRPGNRTYQYSPTPNLSYFIVVKRPYWLSFYARDSARVVWVATQIHRAER